MRSAQLEASRGPQQRPIKFDELLSEVLGASNRLRFHPADQVAPSSPDARSVRLGRCTPIDDGDQGYSHSGLAQAAMYAIGALRVDATRL